MPKIITTTAIPDEDKIVRTARRPPKVVKTTRRQAKEPKVVQCYHCNYSTNIKSNLKKHIINVHVLRRGVPREKHFNCPMCSFNTTRTKMMDHYSHEHDVALSKSSETFVNLEDFRSWKTKVEKEEASRYVVLKGVSKLKSCNVWYYRCHRDGFFNSKGTGKRNLKVKGTNKINGCCPSEMKVMEDKATGQVQVHYIKTHFGHSQDLNRLPLLKEDKDRIAEKIASKIPLNKVLDEIHSSKGEQVERIHLITRKDVLNIASSYKLKNEYVRRSMEGVSPEMGSWVKDVNRESNVIRFYKPQGELSSRFPELTKMDFVLIVANDVQLEYFKEYSSTCVCFDRTHQRSLHDFELTTVMVTDATRQAFPCAFLLSNRSDQEIITMFVSILLSLTGPVETDLFMSDVTDTYYNVWSCCVSVPRFWLFCSWHLDRSVRKSLMKVKDGEKRAFAYRNLRCLILERDQGTFNKILAPTMSDLKSHPELLPFVEYFEKSFLHHAPSWAHCYRGGSIDYTSHNHYESTHKNIRNAFLPGKKSKRLDKSVMDVMRLVKDKIFDQSITSYKGNLPIDLAMINKQHEAYFVTIPSDIVVNKTENSWHWSSAERGESCEVVPNNLACTCHIRCEDCRICIHSYRCNCMVSSLEWTICKHIHYVASSLPETVTHMAIEVQHLPQIQIAQPLQVQQLHIIPQVHHTQHIHPVHHSPQQVHHTNQHVQHIGQQHTQHNHHSVQNVHHEGHSEQTVHHLPQTIHQMQQTEQVHHVTLQVHNSPHHTQLQQHVSSQTAHNSDDTMKAMEVLTICESNVARELEDLIFKQFTKLKDRDSDLKQAKNDALKLVQDIFDAVETRAQLEIFTNAILPVLPTITAMKYSGCSYNK